ncbi:class I SAM-dependent methyltransferase [Anaerocolumna sp. AGMB13020]|uniref:class I SAM-dependent methyltransferase n=1 Tax=Anaerocolumna sp. AGMB13020 TaxID=3081750 RepID=UPI002955A074|nr:class I SAM-dependent methyltransferase [Anaerocolumna sp. AGMB13020]WOO39119.1 class I SAM-dependent methyltransferase [Anaerocolumna sp. AGMB13020]
MKWDSRLYDNKHNFVAEYGKSLLDYVPADKSQNILDLGCGTGLLTAELARKSGCVLGIDGSPDMIEKARKQYPELTFEVMDALELPFDHKWDIIFSNAVFHWIADQELLLQKIHNSLKPSGKLICEFGAFGNIKTIEQGFSTVLEHLGHPYHSKFTFPTDEHFGSFLIKNGFIIEELYAYDRPTPLNDGDKGLYNWAKQFFETDLKEFKDTDQDFILRKLLEEVRDNLWDGTSWVADYKRLKVIARSAL